jgi:hypothetical protein
VLVAAANRKMAKPARTTRIGIDETRARSVRWLFDEAAEEGARWRGCQMFCVSA